MLGVATMIVVNSVMAGFADKMRDRLHGVLADVVVESVRLRRVPQARRDHAAHQERRRATGSSRWPRRSRRRRCSPSSPTAASRSPGRCRSSAIDPESRAKTGDFAKYLLRPAREPDPAIRWRSPSDLRSVPRSPAGAMLKDTDRRQPVPRGAGARALEEVPDQRDDPRLCPGDAPSSRASRRTTILAPEGGKAILTFPTAGRSPEGDAGQLHGRRLLQERDERV